MIFQHGSPEDFDQWESEMGATGWNYTNLKPYFRKAELFTPHPDHKIDIAVSSSARRDWRHIEADSDLEPLISTAERTDLS